MKAPCRVALLACAGLVTGALADEDEAWLRRAPLPSSTAPLLVLVVDTSGSMADIVQVLPPFDPARDYTAESAPDCRPERVYWRLGAGPPPDCGSQSWISLVGENAHRGWRCESGRAALNSTGAFVAARAAQWEPRPAGGYWRALRPGDDGAVECIADRGRHGAAPGSWYAADGAGGPWSGAPDHEPDWHAPPLADAYVFLTGNYLAYLGSTERVPMSRYDWLARRAAEALRSVAGLEVAIARFSHDGLGGDDEGRGGMLALAPTRLPEGAPAAGALLASWQPAGPAPVAETLTEVTRWLAGRAVAFGEASQLAPGQPFPSVPGSRTPDDAGYYLTPFEQACRPVLVAVTTAGRASADAGAAEAAQGLPGTGPGSCGLDCAAALTRGLSSGDLVPSLPGHQRSLVRWLAPADAGPAPREAARSGGRAALDLDAPWAVLEVVAEALQNDSAEAGEARVSAAGLESRPFVAPDSAAYFALSKPAPAVAWPGNLRRYGLLPPPDPTLPAVVVGRDGQPAFDGAGRPVTDSWSDWSSARDGSDALHGGAAAALPDWRVRQVFSDLADAPLTDPDNRILPGNPLLTRERLGLAAGDARAAAGLVEWLLGRDAFDEDLDGDTDEPRQPLGDGGLRAPHVLRYAPDGPALAFIATNDGMLHAFDADTGVERWAFAPSALLPHAAERAAGGLRFARRYGLDGAVSVSFRDLDRDGRLDSRNGDRADLIVGLGRGGTGYYGLDVSDPGRPVLLWALHAADLPGFAQSRPAPVPARMRVDPGVQGEDPRVLVLAGGFDPVEEGAGSPAASGGAAMAIVAAATGTVLWRAGGSADAGAELSSPALRRSLPAAPRLLDTDGDGLHDRAYAVDAGGQLLRLDFRASGTGTFEATLARVADLGNPGDGIAARRFDVTPDVVLTRHAGRDVYAIAFGSGWVSRPRSRGIVDRFYVVFDRLDDPDARVPAEDDLADVTDDPTVVPPDAPGWMLRLDRYGAGEKVTGGSLTFDHRVRFVTYQPRPAAPDAPCGPPAGIARLYTLDVRDGRPVNRVGDRPVPDEELDVEGLAPAAGIAFPAAGGATGCAGAGCRRVPVLLLGGQSLSLDFRNDPVRTSWRQLDADAE